MQVKISETIVLVPGLGLGGLEMYLMLCRLRKLGYRVITFKHFPWRGSLADKALALHTLVTAIDGPIVHFVGHSMGGVIILELFRNHVVRRTGKIVLLGAPVNGSLAARHVARIALGRLFLGQCMAYARDKSLALPENRAVSSISGRLDWGLGRLLQLPCPNDSVVSVTETQRPEMQARCVLPVTHESMLLSLQVVTLIHSFLKTGIFSGQNNDENDHINHYS